MYDWSIIGDKIFGILKGSGFHLKMFDKEGAETIDAHEATRFYATTASQDPDLKQFSILISVHDENARSHIDLKTPKLRNDVDFKFVMKIKNALDASIGDREGIKINWYKFDRVIQPRDAIADSISESRDISRVAGTTRSSYQRVGNSRIILRHTDSIDETKQGSRWRKIKSIFVENHLGERFLYPHIHPAGARAMARHFTNSGTMHDSVGQSILTLSRDYQSLKKAHRLLNSAGEVSLSETLKETIKTLNRRVHRLSGPRGYATSLPDLEKPINLDEHTVNAIHQDICGRCGCSEMESEQSDHLKIAARYLAENNVEIDDNIRFISQPDLTSRASTFDNQRARLAWQVSQLSQCLAPGKVRDQLTAIAADLEDGRVLEPDELDLIRKVFIACKNDSETPFEPSDPELDRVRQLSGL